jgi:ATP-binding cassette subfamily C (CFTR/MRP) protein 4
MTSIERVNDYISIKPEPLNSGQIKPESEWPNRGLIKFENVKFTYDSTLPPVLKNLSITINPGEKVGVVGRTGAGKSSLFQTLFRMAEPEGSVIIDNIDIKNISLHDLRSKIAIIPVKKCSQNSN